MKHNYRKYLKSSILWDIRTFSPVKMNRPFGGIYRLHLQERRVSQEREQREAGMFTARVMHISCLAYFVVTAVIASN
jgi:hypothetical protein